MEKNICSFDTKSGINQHVRNVHERIGEVVCHICAKVYNSKVNLRAHLLDHADVPQPRVTCEICGNSFKSEQNRIRHVKRHQEKGVPCPHCHKISPNRNALKSHIVSVHSKPMLECHLCEKKFKRTLALTVSIGFGSKCVDFCYNFLCIYIHRNTWQRTPEKIYIVARIVRRGSNTIPVCIYITEASIQLNGMPIAKRNHTDKRELKKHCIID